MNARAYPGERRIRDLFDARFSLVDASGPTRAQRAAIIWAAMDEGLPIAYEVLDEGVAVYSSDGEQVGTVEHVVAAPAQDIFHGIVIRSDAGPCFVAADQVASLHERGVDLRIDAAAARSLSAPDGAAPAWRVHEPGAKPSRWRHLLDELEGTAPARRDWTEEE